MTHPTLRRSLEASEAYYTHLFEAMRPEHEKVRLEQKQTLIKLYRELAAIEARLQALAPDFDHKYNPDQPRVPAGSADGGQWTSGDGGSSLGAGTQYADSGQIGTDAQVDTPDISQPAKNFAISNQGLKFIAGYEKFSPSVYLDQGGRPTIGYGHLITDGQSYPNGITHDEAIQLFRNDTAIAVSTVQNDVKVPLSQNQFDALSSLTYNIGVGAFGGSTVLHLLNQGDYTGAADHFADWNRVTNQETHLRTISEGLTNRRNAEENMFLHGIYP